MDKKLIRECQNQVIFVEKALPRESFACPEGCTLRDDCSELGETQAQKRQIRKNFNNRRIC